MNNFNMIFAVVKKNCLERPDTAAELDAILKEVNIKKERLEFYINCLYEVGLVEYSKEQQLVKLTPAGKGEENVFMS